MEKKRRIYCIEGVHDWGEGEVEPTVEPMLELLRPTGHCDYLYRTCATTAELKFRLKHEWNDYCTQGTILLFSTHGCPDKIWLQPEDKNTVVHVGALQELIRCEGQYVHFSGCNTFGEGDHNLKKFMEKTKAVSVSGFSKDIYWISKYASGLTVEVQYLGLLEEIARKPHVNKSKLQKLKSLKNTIIKGHSDCYFQMLIRR